MNKVELIRQAFAQRQIVTDQSASPVVPGTDRWRDLVAEGVARDASRNWFLGDAALEIAPMGVVGAHNGTQAYLEQFADEVGVKSETIRLYRQVAASWPPVTRVTGASHKVHAILMRHKDLIRPRMTVAQANKLLATTDTPALGFSEPYLNTEVEPRPIKPAVRPLAREEHETPQEACEESCMALGDAAEDAHDDMERRYREWFEILRQAVEYGEMLAPVATESFEAGVLRNFADRLVEHIGRRVT